MSAFDDFFVMHGADQRGPYTLDQVRNLWSAGSITSDSLYWQHGMEAWQPLADLLDTIKPPPGVAARHPLEDKKENPPNFGLAMVFAFIPGLEIVSLIFALVWLGNPRWRSAGVAMLLISFVAPLAEVIVWKAIF